MAERAAHLTSTTQEIPSFFDYVAQGSLNDLLKPAGKKVIEALYLTYPNNIEFLLGWYDEVFLFGSSLLNLYYLKKYNSSFSECLYGLKRISGRTNATNLSKLDIVFSIITISLVPYVQQKLNAKAEELYFKEVSRKDKARKDLFLKVNSTLQIGLQLANFVQHLRYLSGETKYSSPLLWLSGLHLAYAEVTEEPLSWRNVFPMMMQRSFELGTFFFQCYHRWQNEGQDRLGKLPAPPPPEVSADDARFAGICPICHQSRKVDTVLSVSGFVFCFTCIQRHIAEYQQCPITKYPATFQDLIRLFPDGP